MLSEEEKKEGDVGEEREESLKNPNGDGRWKIFRTTSREGEG